jgi:hypothetical protein
MLQVSPSVKASYLMHKAPLAAKALEIFPLVFPLALATILV